MKIVLFLLVGILGFPFAPEAQNKENIEIIKLDKVKPKDVLSGNNVSVIYGLFIQRLAFSGGGFPQEIRIVNIDTKDIYSFNVKSTMGASKKNKFCYFIKPGTYKILHYYWTKSKWYGGETHIEPIYKNIDSSGDLEYLIENGEVDPEQMELFFFTIDPGTVNYMGTWDFNSGFVSFENAKNELDKKISKKFKNINFESARIILPK